MSDKMRAGRLVESIQTALAEGKIVQVAVKGFEGTSRIKSATMELGIVTFMVGDVKSDDEGMIMVTAPALLAVVIS